MANPLHVLIVEDSDADALLAMRLLRQADYDVTYTQVQNAESMRDALKQQRWDVVLSDYSMPHLNGHDALRVLQSAGLDIPFIMLSGEIGDELAVALIKAGAHDCVSKNNLPRLVPVIQREIKQAQVRQTQRMEHLALRRSEARFRAMSESSPVALAVNDPHGNITYLNPKFTQTFGYTTADIPTLTHWWPRAYPDPAYRDQVISDWANAISATNETQAPSIEVKIVCKDGSQRTVLASPAAMDESWLVFLYDITERKRSEEELHRKNTELERFTNMVSHDLKSPLVTVKTFLGFLINDLAASSTERITQDIQFIAKATDKMGQLLSELEEMSRIGRVQAKHEPLVWRDVVNEALIITAGAIRQHAVNVTVDDVTLHLVGEQARLVQVWQNLIDNAIKFMAEQTAPAIHIGVERSGQNVTFFVRDNGQGIDPRYQEKIFGLFEKLDSQSPGTGLGLALVKRIIEQYNGTITVDSTGTGQGACFRFTLPTALTHSNMGESA